MITTLGRPLVEALTVVPRLVLPVVRQLDELLASRSIELAGEAVAEAHRRRSLREALEISGSLDDRHSAA